MSLSWKELVSFGMIWLSSSHFQFSQPLLVHWNVGQGSWATIIEQTHCHHIDMGGERFPQSLLIQACSSKINTLSLTHYDFDHIRWVKLFKRRSKHLCLAHAPPTQPWNDLKQLLAIHSMPKCKEQIFQNLKPLDFTGLTKPKNSNDQSWVYLVAGQWLVTGDGSAKQEREWLRRISDPDRITGLTLGHHGSQTSTGPELLQSLPHLKMSVASQRREKYGHPHPIIKKRLQSKGIALLTTQDWGHIIIEL